MPLYEYRCPDCDTRYEVLQSFSDPPKTICKECEGTRLEKLISAPSFQFKGSGWYVTDYARKADDKAGGDDKSSADDKASGDGEKSDVKTTAKSSDGDKKTSTDGGKTETASKDAKSSSKSKPAKASSSGNAAT